MASKEVAEAAGIEQIDKEEKSQHQKGEGYALHLQ